MKVIRAIVVAVVVVGFGASLHAQLADGIKVVSGIKAIVHDSVVTYREVEAYTAPFAEQLRRQYRAQPEVYDQKLAETLNDSLEQLLERQLILHDFTTAGYSMPEAYIDEAVQERIRARYGDRANLTKSLQAEGMTYEKFRQQMRDQIIVEALRGKNVSSEIIISPHKIETYYLAHQDQFKLEDEIKLRMIVLNKPSESETPAVRRQAAEILGKIKEGAAFSEMAAVYSQGSQRNQGGDWGWVERKVLRKELSDVAFALKPGELSGVIETPEACYLMLVEEKRAAHVKLLSDVQDEIEKIMLTQERSRLQKQYVDRLKKKTFVRYF
ncbi:MAG: peptidylprolyl isomerase [Verrucomicrobia bacterium]|jgi:parvulin-like peptidyl-prolyl isomerase|nr:peptidylprolyl isomerase [Verrucomicrobiota bacterium]